MSKGFRIDVFLLRTWPPMAHEWEGPKVPTLWEGRAIVDGEGEKKEYILEKTIIQSSRQFWPAR